MTTEDQTSAVKWSSPRQSERADHHIHEAQAGFLVEGHVVDSEGLQLSEIVAAGETSGGLPSSGDTSLEHGQELFAVHRIAGFDHQVEDQTASAGVRLV